MANFTAIENNDITVDLIARSNTTGWSIDEVVASHDLCNSGSIKLLGYPLVSGQTYQVSYSVLTVSGGYVQLVAGTTGGIHRTTTGLFIETIVANGTQLSFFSNANCTIVAFNIRVVLVENSNTQQNTIVYSEQNRKWSEFRTIAPDYGFSLFIDMFTVYNGALYRHENGSNDRNNFYGVQYQSIFQFVENKEPALIKSFHSLALQSNELLVTTSSGITTSLGQVSELSEVDFIKSLLQDGVSNVTVEAQEGIFSASFLSDKNVDLIGNDPLKGNYITITLTTINGNAVLQLFSVAVNASRSFIGTR